MEKIEGEIWKDITGYEGWCQVSNLGRIKNLEKIVIGCNQHGTFERYEKEKILKQHIAPNGYSHVGIFKDGKQSNKMVHRLVIESFIPNTENKSEINHKDGNKQNNRLYNLEWCTHSENCRHKHDILGYKSAHFGKTGKLDKNSKPTLQYDKQMNFIREWDSVGDITRNTNIPGSNIVNCCNGRGGYKSAGGYIWKYK